MSDSEWEYSGTNCQKCGTPMRITSCYVCFGAGEFDLYDEDPFWYDLGDTESCAECGGVGEIEWCPECAKAEHSQSDDEKEGSGGETS